MIIPLVLMMSSLIFALCYLQATPEESIIGIWKHHKDDVFLAFFRDGIMSFKIPYIQGSYEIPGKYELMDGNLLKIEFDHQYGAISGEQIFTNPRVLKVTIHVNEIIFHNLSFNESKDQRFIRIK